MTTKREVNLPIQKGNWVKIKFGWSEIIVLPYKSGIDLFNTLQHAETLDRQDTDTIKIVPYKGDIEMTVLNEDKYKDYKANALLVEDK